MVKIEMVYVAKDKTTLHLHLELENGATVSDALDKSKLYVLHPETRGMTIGIYAKHVSVDTVLKDGDRIEIYRPLALDPKETRRQRAKVKK